MPFGAVTLRPGANVEPTPTALQAGYSQTALGRFRAGFFEKLGGWVRFFAFALNGVPRALQAWQDLNGNDWLAVGTTAGLDVVLNGVQTDISPQTLTSNVQPSISSTSSSKNIVITDANISNVTTYDSVFFNAPIAVGGIVLSGAYPISVINSSTSYTIVAASAATETRQLATITHITNANPAVVTATNDFANSDLIYIYGVGGMTQVNGRLFSVSAVSGSGFTLTGIDSTGYGSYTSGGSASEAAVPEFNTTNGSALVTVTMSDHGLVAGNTIVFPISTAVGGVAIQGTYTVVSVTDSDDFVISVNALATSSSVGMMNSGEVQIVYTIALGPIGSGTAYSFSTYSSGTYSGVGGPGSQQTGTDLAASDWTLDNWGSTLLACPAGGGIYQWTPSSGLQNAQIVSTAPILNSGIFVATPYQILIAFGTTVQKTIGIAQDPLAWAGSDILDYTYWTPNGTNPTTGNPSQAYTNRIPTGSGIQAGLATPNQILLWTDLDVWSLNYLGPPLLWGQVKIGSNCGTVSRHSVSQMSGVIYWMGRNNFYYMPTSGLPATLTCTVWDIVFQNINTNFLSACWAQTVTGFSEVWFFYPSSASTGQCDSYAKVNVVDGVWDYGSLPRSIGIDKSVVGQPIMATPTGLLYSHETGYNADGQPLTPFFQTGWFVMTEGEDFVFIDQFLPDFKYTVANGSTTSATIQVTFYSTNFPWDTPTSYGPYTMTTTTEKLDLRIRGRQFAFSMTSSDVGSFWRLGRPKFRYALSGRR